QDAPPRMDPSEGSIPAGKLRRRAATMKVVAKQRVLIVGGGASGALVAVHMLRQGGHAVTIAEPSLQL
ncbi:hypothetical protein ABTN05_19155, partial [Acinetobacter baumannii]